LSIYQEIYHLLLNDLALWLHFTLRFLTIQVVVFVLYVLESLEIIAEEIEDPFGIDAND